VHVGDSNKDCGAAGLRLQGERGSCAIDSEDTSDTHTHTYGGMHLQGRSRLLRGLWCRGAILLLRLLRWCLQRTRRPIAIPAVACPGLGFRVYLAMPFEFTMQGCVVLAHAHELMLPSKKRVHVHTHEMRVYTETLRRNLGRDAAAEVQGE
jgi:hypothetical protein